MGQTLNRSDPSEVSNSMDPTALGTLGDLSDIAGDPDVDVLITCGVEAWDRRKGGNPESPINALNVAEIQRHMSAAFSKFPGHEGLISLAFNIVTQDNAFCEDKLPSGEPPLIAYELLKTSLESFSTIDNKWHTQHKALVIVTKLLARYPAHLPAFCDVSTLANLINGVLKISAQQEKVMALQAGMDLVDLLKLLDQLQLEELSVRGVPDSLWAFLKICENTEPDCLVQIIACIDYFPSRAEHLTESVTACLLHAAKQFPANVELQRKVWNLLAVHCKLSAELTKQVLAVGALDAAVVTLQQDCAPTSCSVLEFLGKCRKTSLQTFSQLCLKHDSVLQALAKVTVPSGYCELVCTLLASVIDSCGIATCVKLFELKLVSRLEECARREPQQCLGMACRSIEKILSLLSSDAAHVAFQQEKNFHTFKAQFFDEGHQFFIQDMLACVTTSYQVEVVYTLLQRVVRVCPQGSISNVCTASFMNCFIRSFVRDVDLFPDQVWRVVFTAHLLLFQIRTKSAIEVFRDANFHVVVIDIIRRSDRHDPLTTVVTLGLLSALTSKYHEYLKDLKVLLNCNAWDTVIEKVSLFGRDERAQFGDDVTHILLTMTADKDIAQELFKSNCLDKLLELLDGNFSSVIRRCAIHSIGNIALGGHKVKQALTDRHVHSLLLEILKEKADSEDVPLLSACGRLLHILATGDSIKREFVELGCVGVLLRVLDSKKDHAEVCWRSLGLLSSLGFVTVAHRRYVITQDVLDVVVDILNTSAHGKVMSYAALILLAVAELDEGVVRLREMGVHQPLSKASDSSVYKIQGPDLERWAGHVGEKLSLYTVAVSLAVLRDVSLPPPTRSSYDWPPLLSNPFLPIDSGQRTAGSVNTDNSRELEHQCPVGVELDGEAEQQLRGLGIDTNQPLFRVGRVYGSSYGLCSNCEMDGMSEELVIRPHSLTPQQYQNLIDNGWYRRGGVKMFRLRQNHRAQCCDWETRVLVKDFDSKLSKSYSKVLRRIPRTRLTVETLPSHFCRDAFNLYNDYHVKKHDKPVKSEYSYAEHAVNSPVSIETINDIQYGTYHQLYRFDGRLVAVAVIDIVPKGIVSVYMWYSLDKEVSKYSLGVYSALKEIEMVQELSKKNPEMKYYYLQGWNENNKKLAYKASYPPEEFYCACITPEWLPSLEAVKEAKQKYLQEHTPSSDVTCSSFEKDRAKYEQLTGHKPDVSKIVVCLNYGTYLHLGEMFSKFNVDQSQKELMERRFEELLVAVGPELGANLIIDLKVASSLDD